MTAATEACDVVAGFCRELPTTALRAGRILREDNPLKWPQGSHGRGRIVRVNPDHLFNLTIAMVLADPITEAPRVVDEWGAFRPKIAGGEFEEGQSPRGGSIFRRGSSRIINPSAEQVGDRAEWLEGGTLREAITWLIHCMAKPGNEPFRAAMRESALVVRLRAGNRPTAIVTGIGFNKAGQRGSFSDYYFPDNLADREMNDPVTRETTLSLEVFETLADLWAGTIAHSSESPSVSSTGSAPASADPGNENAAPARAARTRKPKLDCDSKVSSVGRSAEDTCEGANPQALSDRGSGRSFRSMRTTAYELSESCAARSACG